MKLATFIRDGAAAAEIGVVEGDRIFPSPKDWDGPSDMRALISGWNDYAPRCAQWPSSVEALQLANVRLLAPVPDPCKIMALGLNYADHVAESGLDRPTEQIWFGKMSNSVNGPHDPIILPAASTMVDYEVEMVAVIGKRAKRVTREDAPEHVFGYCVGNDVSIRDWQFKTAQWTLGKSGDTHAPFGPFITTSDEVGDPHSLDITLHVNGEIRQSSNTRHLIFDVYDQISELSQIMTLEPGDIIFTGTPGGIGFAMKPPALLAAGDKVTCEIAKLGVIEGIMTPETEFTGG